MLEQPAQLERRALAAIAHDGRRDVARAIDLPIANGGASRSRIALRAGRAALSLLAGSAALALAGDQLPALPGQLPGLSRSATNELPPTALEIDYP